MATLETDTGGGNVPSSAGNNNPYIGGDQAADGVPSHSLLTSGFMKQTMPIIESIQEKIVEVKKNQDVLIESLQRENEKFTESNVLKELDTSLAEVKHYRTKLVNIHKDMSQLSQKTRKLKQRSEKLTLMKQKEELKEEEKKRKLLEQERSLIAKPASDSK